MSNKNWENNAIQFPRLLAEIVATQEHLDIPALAESMDLSVEEVNELFDRADQAWESIKEGWEPLTEVTINTFDDEGNVTGNTAMEISPESVSDIVSHAAQLVKVRTSGKRSSGDTDNILSELEEAVSISGILDVETEEKRKQGSLTP